MDAGQERFPGQGTLDRGIHIIHQTSHNLKRKPRHFMEATLNETPCQTGRGVLLSAVSSICNPSLSFPPQDLGLQACQAGLGVHRDGWSVQQHQSSPEPSIPPQLAPTLLLSSNPVAEHRSSDTDYRDLEFGIWNCPRNLISGEEKRMKLQCQTEEEFVFQEEILHSLTTFHIALHDRLELRQWQASRLDQTFTQAAQSCTLLSSPSKLEHVSNNRLRSHWTSLFLFPK